MLVPEGSQRDVPLAGEPDTLVVDAATQQYDAAGHAEPAHRGIDGAERVRRGAGRGVRSVRTDHDPGGGRRRGGRGLGRDCREWGEHHDGGGGARDQVLAHLASSPLARLAVRYASTRPR
jgi:hypothetical protein